MIVHVSLLRSGPKAMESPVPFVCSALRMMLTGGTPLVLPTNISKRGIVRYNRRDIRAQIKFRNPSFCCGTHIQPDARRHTALKRLPYLGIRHVHCSGTDLSHVDRLEKATAALLHTFYGDTQCDKKYHHLGRLESSLSRRLSANKVQRLRMNCFPCFKPQVKTSSYCAALKPCCAPNQR